MMFYNYFEMIEYNKVEGSYLDELRTVEIWCS